MSKVEFPAFTKLQNLINKFGFKEVKVDAKVMEEIAVLNTFGEEISDIRELIVNSEGILFKLYSDGSIGKVNLYIASKDGVENLETAKNLAKNYTSLYKYHILQCSTLTSMFNSNRKYRYKINTRNNGTFYFLYADFNGKTVAKSKNQKLAICKNCLKLAIGRNSDYDVANFNLKDFRDKNISVFSDNIDFDDFEQGEDVQANVYPQNWNSISKQIKELKNYTCEICNWNPKTDKGKRFIHTHHQNGDKTKNTPENLKALCIDCHSKQPYHSQIQNLADYKTFQTEKYFL